MTRLKVVAFDLFGTVFDLTGVPRDEIIAYIDHIEQPVWSPLSLPATWETLPPFSDSAEGLSRLCCKYVVVTCSNAPLGFTSRLLKNSPLPFDVIVPLQANQVYKPDPKAYLTICEVVGVEPSEVLMVTGNPQLGRRAFGDVEAAGAVGMNSVLIRKGTGPSNIVELAASLNA